MTWKFGKQSIDNLKGVDPKLVAIAYRALELSDLDFGITEGLRTLERQKVLLAEKKTKTLKSYHLTGKAIDIKIYKNGEISWDIEDFAHVSKFFMQAARELGAKITWGGDWDHDGDWKDESFRDGPHFQLEN